MTYILAASLLLHGGVVFVFLSYLKELQDSYAKERRELISRIQTPEIAPTLAFQEPVEEGQAKFIPFEDDEAWDNYVQEASGGRSRTD